MKNKKSSIVPIVSVIIILAAGYGLYKLFTFKPDFSMPQMPPPTVTLAQPRVMDVEQYYDFTGTTVAVEEVEIRARVQGYLDKIHFVEGSLVKKGDLLYEIERPTYQAIHDQALAQLQSRQAELKRAQLDLERVEQAIKSNAVSQEIVSTRRAQRDQAQAGVDSAKAALEQAKQDLGYTWVHSPIDGRISRKYVDIGNLVGTGEHTLLSRVVKLKPIYVHFHVSERFITEKLGIKTFDGKTSRPFFVAMETETGFEHEGVLNYMDNKVDSGTGTILLRGELPNTEEEFLPGMFVRVRVPIGTKKDAVCVHDQAINTDIGGKFLLIVNKEGIVQRRPVELGRVIDQMRVITSGITADDSYILKGGQSVYPGMNVNTVAEGQMPAQPNTESSENNADQE